MRDDRERLLDILEAIERKERSSCEESIVDGDIPHFCGSITS